MAKYQYIGNGPTSTGSTVGWILSPNLYARCSECGYYMNLSPNVSDTCTCGKLHKDAQTRRFGSIMGDCNIDVYQLH